MNDYTIYMHKNKINNKVYIGQTCQSLEKRFGSNGCQYKSCKYFYSAIKKYGWDNFEHIVLFSELSKEEANIMEKECIKQYRSRDKKYGYNIHGGGEGFCSEDSTELWMNDEYRQSVTEAIKRKWTNEKYRTEMSSRMREAWKDPQKRKRRSLAAKERWRNDEFRSKLCASVFNACAKKIRCIETETIYDSVKEAAEKLNLSHGNAKRAVTRGYKWGGFHWEYVDIS